MSVLVVFVGPPFSKSLHYQAKRLANGVSLSLSKTGLAQNHYSRPFLL